MSKKSSGKIWGSVLIAAILVGSLSIFGTWYYLDSIDTDDQTIASLQSQLSSRATTISPATLTLTNTGAFTFDTAIDANGGVASDDTADEDAAPTFTITNDDQNDNSIGTYITLYDLEGSDGGLGAVLEAATASFYVTVGGVRTPLYTPEGGYSSGVLIGNIAKNGGVAGAYTLTCIIDSAADDTYPDDASDITIYLYAYQSSADDSTRLAFTFST